jgi:hypothetical protein
MKFFLLYFIYNKMATQKTHKDAPTELTEPEKVNKYFTGLIEVSKNIHDDLYGSMSNTLWLTRLTKVQAAYIKSKNPLGWKSMFTDFFSTHSEEIMRDVFHESGVNDKWLKNTTNYESSSKGWASGATCKGLIIYFNTDPKHRAVSIAISEIYAAACKVAKEKGESSVKILTYPAKLLYNFYSLISVGLDELDPASDQINRNVTALKTFIDEMSPETESSVGSGGGGIADMMSAMMKSSGVDTGGVDAGSISSIIEETMKGDSVKGITDVISKIMASMNGAEGEEQDNTPAGVMNKLSDVLGNQEIRDMLTSSAENASSVITDLVGSVSGGGGGAAEGPDLSLGPVDGDVEAVEALNPGEQE